MRRYLSGHQLSQMLNKLTEDADPRLVRIFAELYIYKENPQNRGMSYIKNHLEAPLKMVLAFVNLAVISFLWFLVPGLLEQIRTPGMMLLLFAGFGIVTFYFLGDAMAKAICYKKSKPYLLIDELIERDLVTLVRRD